LNAGVEVVDCDQQQGQRQQSMRWASTFYLHAGQQQLLMLCSAGQLI
jgi:hypothetical protein